MIHALAGLGFFAGGDTPRKFCFLVLTDDLRAQGGWNFCGRYMGNACQQLSTSTLLDDSPETQKIIIKMEIKERD